VTLKELEKIVQTGENQYVEFKHKVNFPEKIAKEIVAFCNTNNGKLIIGVDDNKTIFGLKNVKEELFALENVIKKFVLHPIEYQIDIVKINEKKDVIVLSVYESKTKPNYALEKITSREGIVYVRNADKSIKASRFMIELLEQISTKDTNIFKIGNNEKKVLEYISLNQGSTLTEISNSVLLSNLQLFSILSTLISTNIVSVKFNNLDEEIFF
jgi:predicted HTH transcriptional regulator